MRKATSQSAHTLRCWHARGTDHPPHGPLSGEGIRVPKMVTVEGEGYLFSCGVWLGLLFGAEVLEKVSVQRVGPAQTFSTLHAGQQVRDNPTSTDC